jgi:hypothetical protein
MMEEKAAPIAEASLPNLAGLSGQELARAARVYQSNLAALEQHGVIEDATTAQVARVVRTLERFGVEITESGVRWLPGRGPYPLCKST